MARGMATVRGPQMQEAAIRTALSSIPMSRLRDAGLMDTLLKLADAPHPAGHSDGAQEADAIDEMDVEDLIRHALNEELSDAEPES